VERAPGHDEYARVLFLITAIGFKIRFWVQVSGTPLDCFVIR